MQTQTLSPTPTQTASATKIKKVLMCRPLHFNVEYIINPHMQPHSVDKAKALEQWDNLVAALQKTGITVEIIDQIKGLPDMVFATDQAIVRGREALLANFRYAQRKKETPHFSDWFEQNGYKVRSLSNTFSFEGGDTLFFGNMLMVGTGFRANVGSCEELSKKLNIDVFPLRLVNPDFYHLDMCFLPLDRESAFYYPPAFSPNSQAMLKRLVKNLYMFTQAEAEGYAANSLVSGNTVITQARNLTFKSMLERLGKTVVEVDLSEFQKAGGGIHCLTNVLE